MLLQDLTWPEVKELPWDDLVVIFPTGSFEQHGLHLPLTTDTDIADAIGKRIEQGMPDKVLLLPTLWPGHSTHHMHFPGTLDVPQMPYIQMVCSLCSSIAAMGGRKIFLLNGHGGNDVPLRAALRELKTSTRDVPGVRFVYASYWTIAAKTIREVRESGFGGINHACEMETSIMLHLCPQRVKMERAKRDGPTHTDAYRKADMQYGRPVYFVNEFHEVSETGVVGDPTLATAEKGKRFLDGIVAEVTAFVEAFGTW
jgi:creatinine amidohydrolase